MITKKADFTGIKGNDGIFTLTEEYAAECGLSDKDSLHLRLLVEEILEMLRILDDEQPAELSLEGDGKNCVIRLALVRDILAREEYLGRVSDFNGVTDKIRFLLSSSYETIDAVRDEAEKIGVRKQKAEDLKEAGLSYDEDVYVWTMESYNLSAFDRFEESGEADWVEISRSIIANIADDVRIFILHDRTEYCVYMSFGEEVRAGEGKYAINPELLPLYKIPVAKTRFQIKLVQVMYKRLPYKQRATEEYSLILHSVPCEASPKRTVQVLEYIPTGVEEEISPAVLLMHGGAFLFPALPYHFRLAAAVAERTGSRVFLPIYDLAPKYNPPVQNREAFEMYRELLDNAEKYLIDESRIAVMGDSSGGTMSAAICLLARDEGIQKPCGQLLLYPSLDTRGNTASMEKYPDVPVVNAEAINAYKNIIHADKEEGKKYYLSPIEAESLSDLPPAYIEPAEFDALHDEGVAYAQALRRFGCEVTLNETKGTVHSFDMAKDSKVLAHAMDRRIDFLKKVLGKH